MKKIIIIALCSLLVGLSIFPAYAFDPDGLWMSSEYNGAFMVKQNNGSILVIALRFDDMGWEAYFGAFNGKSARLYTLAAGVSLDASVNFYSDTSAYVFINNCTPITNYCTFPKGASLEISKVY